MTRPGPIFLSAFIVLCFATAQGQAPRKLAFRAENYDVSARLNPTDQTLTGRARVEFRVLEASRVVMVEMHPNLKVTAVLGEDGKPMAFERDASAPLVLRVTLPDIAAINFKVALTFEYSGPLANEENSPVKGVTLAAINPDGAYLLLPARWFPLTDYPSNRYTAVFHLEVPQNFAVVGEGRTAAPSTVSEKPSAPSKARPQPAAAAPAPRLLYTFRNDQPAAAGTFVAGSLQLSPVRAEGLNISVYTAPATLKTASTYGESAARILNFFSAEIGPLPEPNLTVAQLPEGTVPGYSGPGLILIGARQWDPKVNYRLLAQLIAGQWWGNQVLPASANDVWLTDGLARYCEGLYVEHLAGKEGFNRALEDFAVSALMYEDAAPIAQAGRLQPFTSEYRSVVINKGAMVYHMLHAQLGDDGFHALLRDVYSKLAGKTARIEEFEALAQARAEAKAGTSAPPPNLKPFFYQWLNSTGVPEFRVEYIVYRTPKGFKTVGKIKQDLETLRMPIEIKVETEGNPETRTVEVIGTSTDFTIETFGRPKPGGIVLDPNNNILKSSAKLRVRAGIARGEELAQQGRYFDAIQQYQQALDVQKNNALANFRMGEAFFFQKNYQAAANAFREAYDGYFEASYKWVEVWSHIYLGKIYDITGQRDRAVNEYSKAQQLNDDTGGAQEEAARYLKQPYKEDTNQRSGNP